jgi:16S rRNA (cytidine1402-2'-O)-methyltransferase
LLTAVLGAGIEVTVLPGPSAVETALVASGLGEGQYRFLGYLPRAAAALRRLWEDSRGWPYVAVAFDSPRRLPASLASLAEIDPGRPMAVCRELTKRYEEVVRGTAAELATRFAEPVKGEVTVVVGAGAEHSSDLDMAEAAVGVLVLAGAARRAAVDVVSRLVDVPRNALYRRSLAAPRPPD